MPLLNINYSINDSIALIKTLNLYTQIYPWNLLGFVRRQNVTATDPQSKVSDSHAVYKVSSRYTLYLSIYISLYSPDACV